jgi:branched-subunit amino acid ABC-type transport system permease component
MVRVLGMVFTATQLTLVAIAAVALAALHGLLRYTRLGKAMRATASDPELARNCGVQTRRVIDAAWLLSGLLCGLAGVPVHGGPGVRPLVADPPGWADRGVRRYASLQRSGQARLTQRPGGGRSPVGRIGLTQDYI